MVTCNKCKQQFISLPKYRRHVCPGEVSDIDLSDQATDSILTGDYYFLEEPYPTTDIGDGIEDDANREFKGARLNLIKEICNGLHKKP